MKSEVHEKEKQELKFPCLMIHRANGNVFIITSRNCDGSYAGTVVSSKNMKIGNHLDMWTRDLEPFNGTVTLSND